MRRFRITVKILLSATFKIGFGNGRENIKLEQTKARLITFTESESKISEAGGSIIETDGVFSLQTEDPKEFFHALSTTKAIDTNGDSMIARADVESIELA